MAQAGQTELDPETLARQAAAQAAIRDLRTRVGQLDDNGLDLLFRCARSYNSWQDRPVSDDQLRALYDIMKFSPTSTNGNPARLVFVKSSQAKDRLRPALHAGNVPKMDAAPVTAIVAYDLAFFEALPRLFPHREVAGSYRADAGKAGKTAFRNSSIQGAFLILAARALGLDAGPMSGFDNKAVDETFFAGTTLRTNFLCNLGYGDPSTLFGRLPRFDFDEVCTIL